MGGLKEKGREGEDNSRDTAAEQKQGGNCSQGSKAPGGCLIVGGTYLYTMLLVLQTATTVDSCLICLLETASFVLCWLRVSCLLSRFCFCLFRIDCMAYPLRGNATAISLYHSCRRSMMKEAGFPPSLLLGFFSPAVSFFFFVQQLPALCDSRLICCFVTLFPLFPLALFRVRRRSWHYGRRHHQI